MGRSIAATALLSLLLGSQTASAAGFYLSEVGTPGSLGTGGVANPTNTWGADASWTNPAGMTALEERSIVAGFQVIAPKIEFDTKLAEAGGDDGGNAGEVAAVPSFFYATPVNERLHFGFSVTGPMGGGIDYGNNFAGRYAVQDVTLQGLGITPSLGYRVNDRLSIGGGVSMIYTVMSQNIALRNPGTVGDGQVRFEDLDDIGFQGILGLTYKITDRALLGVVYRSEADVNLDGKIKFRNAVLPLPGKSSLSIDWTNPQWLEAGLRFDLKDDLRLFFNAGWQDWSEFSDNVLSVNNGKTSVLNRNWRDTWHAGVALGGGAEGEPNVWSVGVSYDSSPVRDKDRTFDFPVDETWKLSASYSWVTKDGLDFAIGSTLYLVGDAPIDQTSQGVRAAGDFDSNLLWFVGGALRYEF